MRNRGRSPPCRVPAVILWGVLIALIVLPGGALAQDVGGAGSAVDDVIEQFSETLTRMGGRAGEVARSLLLILFTLDLVLRFGRWAMQGNSFGEVFGTWTYQLTFVSLVYVLALMVPEVVGALTKLALRFASAAGGGDSEPSASGMITDGLRQAMTWLGEIGVFEPSTWFYIFAAIISIVVTAMTVAFLVITYAEIYLIGLAGIIVLGFAGLEEARGAAISYIRLLIGKALKLMALMIIYGAINSLTTALATSPATGFSGALGMIMLQIIACLLIITLPGSVEGLVSNIGSSSAEGGARTAGRMVQSGLTTTAILGATLGRSGAQKLAGGMAAKLGIGAAAAAVAAGAAGAAARAGSPGQGGDRMAASDALTGDAAADVKARISEAIGRDGNAQ